MFGNASEIGNCVLSPSISSCMFSWVGPLQVGSVQISKTLFNHTFTTSGNKPEFPSQTQQPDHLYGKKQVYMIFITSSTP